MYFFNHKQVNSFLICRKLVEINFTHFENGCDIITHLYNARKHFATIVVTRVRIFLRAENMACVSNLADKCTV